MSDNNYKVPTNKIALFIYHWREWGFKLAWSMLTNSKAWEPVAWDEVQHFEVKKQ